MRILALISIFVSLSFTAVGQISSPQIPLTGNIGCQGFPCLNNGTLIMATDADRTMTAVETSAFYIKVTSSVSLTTTRKLISPAGRFFFTIENATTGGQSIQVIGQSGTGVTIPNGGMVNVWNDGTNYISTLSYGLAGSPNITVGAVNASSLTASGLSVGNCVQVTTGGLLTTTGSACGTSSGTITATGTPASGNLAFFSGATSITSGNLSGDMTTSGTGVTTLATVSTTYGACGSASTSCVPTTNAKGLVTSQTAPSIQIAESQVTNLTTDLAAKQATGNYITALTGDVTAGGPGSAAATVVHAPASGITGTTLASNVVGSSLTSVSTSPGVTTGVWNAGNVTAPTITATGDPSTGNLRATSTTGGDLRLTNTSVTNGTWDIGNIPSALTYNGHTYAAGVGLQLFNTYSGVDALVVDTTNAAFNIPLYVNGNISVSSCTGCVQVSHIPSIFTTTSTSYVNTGISLSIPSVAAAKAYMGRCNIGWGNASSSATTYFAYSLTNAPIDIVLMNSFMTTNTISSQTSYWSDLGTQPSHIINSASPGATADYVVSFDFTLYEAANTSNTLNIQIKTSDASYAAHASAGSACTLYN